MYEPPSGSSYGDRAGNSTVINYHILSLYNNCDGIDDLACMGAKLNARNANLNYLLFSVVFAYSL